MHQGFLRGSRWVFFSLAGGSHRSWLGVLDFFFWVRFVEILGFGTMGGKDSWGLGFSVFLLASLWRRVSSVRLLRVRVLCLIGVTLLRMVGRVSKGLGTLGSLC